MLLDQIVAAPFFALLFIYSADLLEGRSLSHCWAEFKVKFPEIYLFDWFIWPPTQFINFRYVPEQYRVLYVNAITVGWDVFLSYIKHRADRPGEAGESGGEENASSTTTYKHKWRGGEVATAFNLSRPWFFAAGMWRWLNPAAPSSLPFQNYLPQNVLELELLWEKSKSYMQFKFNPCY